MEERADLDMLKYTLGIVVLFGSAIVLLPVLTASANIYPLSAPFNDGGYSSAVMSNYVGL